MAPEKLSRRRFTLLSSIAISGLLVAGCTEPEDPVEPEDPPEDDEGVP